MIWTVDFWKGAAERAFHAFWQTFAAILTLNIGGELIPAVGIDGVSWWVLLSGAAVASILSLAKSFSTPDFTSGASARRAKVPDDGPGTVYRS